MKSRVAIAVLASAILGVALQTAAHAAKKGPEKLPGTHVQDLHYGDVLFQTFIGEDFEALTRLEAYSQWQLMPHHQGEADLLAGGLYLQLGMHNEAGRRFEGLLAGPEIPTSVRGRAWFYLAKVWYARGYFDRTVDALGRIDALLPPLMEAEKQHLRANALMHLGRYDEAITLLEGWKTNSSWMSFARFNLGVALLRSNRLADGAKVLESVGRLQTTNDELLALKDKANLALGFAYLQNQQPQLAKPMLERVRLNGAQSTRALLGMGWADAAQNNYEAALTPWLELRDRNLLDAAVQEAYLAVPYAFAKLGANGQAADYYEQALSSFSNESGRIDESIGRIRDGQLMKNLLGETDGKTPQRGWFWQMQELPDAPESRYLYPILAGNDFQEGLKNYRDMAFLGATLERWDENMIVYNDMIEAREKAYAERIPKVDALLDSDAVGTLAARRQGIEGRFNDIVSSEDVAALGTPAQRDQWRRIERIEAAMAADPGNAQLAAMQEKLRLIRGVLFWDLRSSYRDRLYAERRELKDLDKSLAEANNRWLRVQQARQIAPTSTGDFAARIALLQARMSTLRADLARESTAQGELLGQIAVDELQTQQQRIKDYEVQARFALATIYDRAADAPRATDSSRPTEAPKSVEPAAPAESPK